MGLEVNFEDSGNQAGEEKQSSEWSQKRKKWEHLESSKYIQFSCSVMCSTLCDPHGVSILLCTEKYCTTNQEKELGALGNLLERKRWLSVTDSSEI